MAEPLVIGAGIGAFSAISVAAIGLCGTYLQTRRKPDPTSNSPSTGVDMSAVVIVLGRQIADLEAELEDERTARVACEAREALRSTETRARRGKRP